MFKYTLIIAAFLLSACASEPLNFSKSAKDDYLKGKSLISSNKYGRAVQFLEKFTAKYPYSEYATKAKILRLEAAYLDEQYVLSETLALRFLDTHPTHPQLAHVQYLLGMSYYQESSSANHDQQFSNKARDTFVALNQKFPHNPNFKQAQQYTQELTDRLAEHELIVGKFYFNKKLYVAATNRFILAKNTYPNSHQTDEVLYYLAASYIALKQKDYAKEVVSILQKKPAQNQWRKQAEALM
ncbi:MAG: outer membrane protein assembly factor BamD [Ghiorsea sp.]|nr:outer membrane protein assembly factor BamD [Ghiorsea sp.]MDQ7057200.1 outer membrane protein assembly factor BamD [Ghiorsea sp.]